MGSITSVIDNIASAQESIIKKIDWITDAAAEVSETETLALIINDYMMRLKESIAELRKLESGISNNLVETGGPRHETR